MSQSRVLHLTLKKQWFDMIASGEKPEEYREIKPYWKKRLEGREYDFIHFRNGYSRQSPTMLVECNLITTGLGNPQWGAWPKHKVFILKLGKVISVQRPEKAKVVQP